MDEYTEAEGLGSEAEDEDELPEPEGDTVPRSAYEKAVRREQRAKAELRRAKFTAAHGEDVAGLIPDELPADKWDEFAERLKAFRGQAAQTQESEGTADSREEAVEQPTTAEKRIAALTKPRDSANPSGATLSWSEYRNQLADPNTRQAAMLARKQGLVDESTHPNAP